MFHRSEEIHILESPLKGDLSKTGTTPCFDQISYFSLECSLSQSFVSDWEELIRNTQFAHVANTAVASYLSTRHVRVNE